MASGSTSLGQQKPHLEVRIRKLVNNDLKEICKAYGYQVSGVKTTLQRRVLEILDEVVASGVWQRFEELSYRVGHHGQYQPHPSPSNTNQSTNGTHRPHPHLTSGALSALGRPSSTGRYFKNSPFYEIIDTVLPLQDLPDMPQHRHTVRANLVLRADHVQRFKEDSSLRLLLYCGSAREIQSHQSDVTFPNQLEIKINSDDVRANFKGLKNKPGSTKPADITDKVRKVATYPNQLMVTYAMTTKRFAFMVYLVRYVGSNTLVERIRSGRVIPKHKVLEEMRKANADSEISATSVRMSLKDPISTVRIRLPVRSSICKHNQCFDGAMFLELQEQAPQWVCPVCNERVSFESLCVDQYFLEILEKTPNAIEKVDIEPSGEWKVIKEDENSQSRGGSRAATRAPYDEDSEDDVVDVTDLSPQSTNGVSGGLGRPPLAPSPLAPAVYSRTTPSTTPSQPQSNKRPASAVIDLTFSDDEEQPIRPAKRQTTTSNTHSTPSATSHPHNIPAPASSQYNTPANGSAGHNPGHRPPSNPSATSDSGHTGTATRGSPNPAYSFGASWTANGGQFTSRPSSSSPYVPSGASRSPWAPPAPPPTRQSDLGASDGPAFQGFSLQPLPRLPPMPPNGPDEQFPNDSMRLPPIHSPPLNNGYYNGWRAGDQGSYSSSSP